MVNRTGIQGESLAEEICRDLGFVIIARNWRNRVGEADILAEDKGVMVVVEVKTKTNLNFGDPIEMITKSKQRKLRQLASSLTQMYNKPVRVDVITVLLTRDDPVIHHYKNAITND
jgi:putative endonuclease